MSEIVLHDLVGIPYKFKGHSLESCGCFGVVHLWYKHIKHKNLPWTDGKFRLPWFFRNRKKDGEIIVNGYIGFGCVSKIIDNYEDLQPGDIMVYRGLKDDYAVGVIINSDKCLTTSRKQGTCLITYKKIYRSFYKGIRIDETKI